MQGCDTQVAARDRIPGSAGTVEQPDRALDVRVEPARAAEERDPEVGAGVLFAASARTLSSCAS